MKELEAQISDTRNALEALVARHRELQSEANRSHIPIVLRVPEIASAIFQLCLPDGLLEATFADRFPLAAPLTLGAVCRSWRQIAWSTPRLWSTISILLNPHKYPACSGLVKQWLARSGHLPLSVYMGTDLDNDIPTATDQVGMFHHLFDIINEYSGRWFYLNLEVPGWMISHFVGNLGGATTLHTLKLQRDHYPQTDGQFKLMAAKPAPSNLELCDFRLKDIEIEWGHITHVAAYSLNLEECIELMRRAPKLLQCRFGDVRRQEDYFTMPNNSVIIPDLQILEFEAVHSEVNLFFDHLILPSLQHFAVDMDGERLPSESLASLLKRSACSLKHLAIYKTSFDDTQINELLRATPSLRRLEMIPDHEQNYNGDSLFHLLATTSRVSQDDQNPAEPFLPELQSIKFIHTAPVSWSLIPDIFGLISEIDDPHQRPLRKFQIIVDPAQDGSYLLPVHIIDKKTICRILELMDAGISMQFRYSRRDHDLLQLSMQHHGVTREELEK
ncbi:hypothetical protein GALMADRAFT_150404 [Galerina marginata CBS 339.88]|uniref:Uncharacterized protein n=1 Tax=Galerina marginata (strain CBS 339.88) TaxID=685588 RepID=A0A067TUT0_GALM3|nr:hypothetical protein GALMADRAFT_150404 [Galerina marginata CBS 339.88]